MNQQLFQFEEAVARFCKLVLSGVIFSSAYCWLNQYSSGISFHQVSTYLIFVQSSVCEKQFLSSRQFGKTPMRQTQPLPSNVALGNTAKHLSSKMTKDLRILLELVNMHNLTRAAGYSYSRILRLLSIWITCILSSEFFEVYSIDLSEFSSIQTPSKKCNRSQFSPW